MNNKKKIIITSDGHTVKAQMGNKVGIAKCNLKKDTFDYHTGVQLAINRLFENQSDNTPRFDVGDIVEIVNSGKIYSAYTQWFTLSKVDQKYYDFWKKYHTVYEKKYQIKI